MFLQSKLDKCFILGKDTVWRGINYNILPRVGHYKREIHTHCMSNLLMYYLGNEYLGTGSYRTECFVMGRELTDHSVP